ncbi:MAG TPA: cysteine dioxygenase family protein [Blastocatellia bacterium]|nr:cysteine dioxygenase family protein [Blastocatellia bacterium]
MRVADTVSELQGRSGISLIAAPLADLAQLINGLTRQPTLDEVKDWFAELKLRPHDYVHHRIFTPRKYARNLIARSEHAELLMLCWHSGQRTPIHDHGGSIGVVMVCEGLMTETMYERALEGHVRPFNTFRWSPGGITGADVPDIHQLLNLQPERRDLVTLHCYSPPLSVLNTYSQKNSRVRHWREGYFSGGGGI